MIVTGVHFFFDKSRGVQLISPHPSLAAVDLNLEIHGFFFSSLLEDSVHDQEQTIGFSSFFLNKEHPENNRDIEMIKSNKYFIFIILFLFSFHY